MNRELLELALCRMERVLHALGLLNGKVDKLMGIAQDLQSILSDMNTETNAIAAHIADWHNAVKNSMTDEEVASLKRAMAAEKDRLHVLAQDQANPVPPVPPQLAALRSQS